MTRRMPEFPVIIDCRFPVRQWVYPCINFRSLSRSFIRVKCDAFSFTAIPSASSGFLIVTFETFRYIVMDYVSHIRVYLFPSESNGSNNDLHFFHQETILIHSSLSGIHSCVVRQYRDVIHLECFGQFFHLFTGSDNI